MYQGIVDLVWLNNGPFVVAWLRENSDECMWQMIMQCKDEDKRVDLYKSLIFLLEEVNKRKITELTLIIGDHIILNHLKKGRLPKKAAQLSRYEEVKNLLHNLTLVEFTAISETQKEQNQTVEMMDHFASGEENNPDLVMISFL
ncbi:hypothetical protein [Brevibacillus marinus]|uniref:hypothetical protein n=1 Tax=Brevibacillus marinus TaxID=2496837 RepID=UPI000F81A299|nr:hypothetical protein [Brevibacillus marinus]